MWPTRFAIFIVAAAATVSTAAAAPRRSYWERVAFPQREQVAELVSHAQADLDDSPMTGASLEAVTRAELLLVRALRLEPRHFLARMLLGEALALQRRAPEAIAAFEQACALSHTSDEESGCTLRLAIERSKAGRYADALLDYDRHIRLGEARSATYANSAEILMALGRLGEAQARYREAVRLGEDEVPGRDRDENLALALYGLGVALDRDEQEAAAQEAVVRALSYDPKLALLDAAGDPRVGAPPAPAPALGHGGVFFVPSGDVHYYRGLALKVSGRKRDAVAAFQRFTASAKQQQFDVRWSRRAEAHLLELVATMEDANGKSKGKGNGLTSRERGAYKVAAVATVRSRGALPAPLIDAAWRARPGLIDGCLEDPPPGFRATVRLSLEVDIDAKGEVHEVKAQAPPGEWKALAPCVEARVRAGLRVVKPSASRATSARIELVLAIRQ